MLRLGIRYLKEALMKSPIALLESLLIDTNRLNPAVKGLDRDLTTIKKRFEDEGYGFFAIALPSLDEALLTGLSTGQFTCPTGFKRIRKGAIPRFLSGMLCEVFDPFTGKLKEKVDYGVLKSTREILRLFKKIQMPDREVDKLHKKAVSEFFECDNFAGKFIMPAREYNHIRSVSRMLLAGINSVPTNLGAYKHGPGAVFEGYSPNQKWLGLSDSVKNTEFDLDVYGYADFDISRSYSEQSLTDLSEPESLCIKFTSMDRASSRKARLITVAKSSTARRTITVEPMLNQFIQQGLNTILRDCIKQDSILQVSLDLSNQEANQKLALEGSIYDNWATIDLKSASDLLSVKLVEAVFGHRDSFFKAMMDCRSTAVECSIHATNDLQKFAGMGNALTFPVQSVCFTVVCIAAILDSRGESPDYWKVKRAARLVRTYGDDIIVSTRYAQQCVNWLQAVGLKVNSKKSFLAGNFKESCGVDAFRGVDITPLYVKQRPDQIEASPELIKNYVSLSNSSWMRGLYAFSNTLRDEVDSLLKRRLPLVSRKSGALGWHSRIDAMTPHKWCPNTHKFLTRSYVIRPSERKDVLDGYAALLKFFHVPLLGRDRDHLKKSQIRYKNRISLRWVATQLA
jgi:hypothetical protein